MCLRFHPELECVSLHVQDQDSRLLTPAVPYSYFLPAGIGYGSAWAHIVFKSSFGRVTTGLGLLKTESTALIIVETLRPLSIVGDATFNRE